MHELGITRSVVAICAEHAHGARVKRVTLEIGKLPYVKFDVARCVAYAKEVNPKIEVFQLSATTGEGMENWYDWLRVKLRQMQSLGFHS